MMAPCLLARKEGRGRGKKKISQAKSKPENNKRKRENEKKKEKKLKIAGSANIMRVLRNNDDNYENYLVISFTGL